jgi:hypothetical protein
MTKPILVLTAALVLTGCVVVKDREGNGGTKQGGPPPWAPAHGHRAKQMHHYYYYPSVGIYYDLSARTYFYMSGGTWQVSATLPPRVVLDAGDAVTLELETEIPYLYYEDHQKKYTKKDKKPKGRGRPF